MARREQILIQERPLEVGKTSEMDEMICFSADGKVSHRVHHVTPEYYKNRNESPPEGLKEVEAVRKFVPGQIRRAFFLPPESGDEAI